MFEKFENEGMLLNKVRRKAFNDFNQAVFRKKINEEDSYTLISPYNETLKYLEKAYIKRNKLISQKRYKFLKYIKSLAKTFLGKT